MRSVVKRVVERVLATVTGNPRRMVGRTLVLAYHNVVPDQDAGRGERSLHLPFSTFQRQLDQLELHTRVVPLAESLEPAESDRPRIAITFDDAYRGAVELALPELCRRRLPATLFVAPGILGAARLWWDAMAESAEGLSDARRTSILEQQAGRSEVPAGSQLPPAYGCATEAQVLALAERGITLGAHTWSHPNLARLSGPELEDELERPLAWLEARGMSAPMLAYPYGRTSPEVERAAQAAGYPAAFRVDGGWMPVAGAERWALPRFNVPAGLSEDGFRLRLAGRLS